MVQGSEVDAAAFSELENVLPGERAVRISPDVFLGASSVIEARWARRAEWEGFSRRWMTKISIGYSSTSGTWPIDWRLQRYDVSYEKNEFGRFAYRPAIVAQSGHFGGAQ